MYTHRCDIEIETYFQDIHRRGNIQLRADKLPISHNNNNKLPISHNLVWREHSSPTQHFADWLSTISAIFILASNLRGIIEANRRFHVSPKSTSREITRSRDGPFIPDNR